MPAVFAGFAVAAALTLAGCSAKQGAVETSGSAEATAEAAASVAPELSEVLPPALGTPAELDGKRVTISLVLPLVLTVDDVTAWTAQITDPTVVEFRPGKEEADAIFTPGLVGLQEGATEVTLHGPDGATSTFEVEVLPDDAAVGVK
ncbi:MAG: hypothetical protein Q3999_08020 [Buchananella hordeovulneris]|nr:hypothetical protein [Buchananella hordeovulneris]